MVSSMCKTDGIEEKAKGNGSRNRKQQVFDVGSSNHGQQTVAHGVIIAHADCEVTRCWSTRIKKSEDKKNPSTVFPLSLVFPEGFAIFFQSKMVLLESCTIVLGPPWLKHCCSEGVERSPETTERRFTCDQCLTVPCLWHG